MHILFMPLLRLGDPERSGRPTRSSTNDRNTERPVDVLDRLEDLLRAGATRTSAF